MDLEKKLQQAIERGKSKKDTTQAGDPNQWTPQRLKNHHNNIRLALSDYIESVLKKVDDMVPGFKSEILFGDKGWGTAIYRDDFAMINGSRQNLYSRLEVFVRSMNEYHVVDVATKATIGNKELWNKNFYQEIPEADQNKMQEKVDQWAVEFVEAYTAARG